MRALQKVRWLVCFLSSGFDVVFSHHSRSAVVLHRRDHSASTRQTSRRWKTAEESPVGNEKVLSFNCSSTWTSFRSFYKNQDKLISSFERVHRLHSKKDSDNEDETENELKTNTPTDKEAAKLKRKRISLYIKLSLFVNVVSPPGSPIGQL